MLTKKPEADLSTGSEELTLDDVWRDDKLDRRKVAEYLTPVVASINQPFVLSLESPYGTGKTFFVRRWCKHIEIACKEQGHRTAYFNAWETDFSNDIISAFINSLQKQFGKDEHLKKRIEELARKTAGFLRSKALPLILRGLAKKVLGREAVEETIEHFGLEAEDVASFLSEAAAEALQAQTEAEQAMEDFRRFLSELARELTGAGSESGTQLSNLYVFVDDLDRCRPSYALEVLEAIKHLFAVPGVVFVLALDQGQLKSVIKSVYGEQIDEDGYLRKFIDWGFKLPRPATKKYADALFAAFGWRSLPRSASLIDVPDFFSHAVEAYQLSLRRQAQIFTHLNLVFRHIDPCDNRYAGWLAFFAVLREADGHLYETACLSQDKSIETSGQITKVLSRQWSEPLIGESWIEFQEILAGAMMNRNEADRLRPPRDAQSPGDNGFSIQSAIKSYEKFAPPRSTRSFANDIYLSLEGAATYQR